MKLPDQVRVWTTDNTRSITTKAAVKYRTWDETIGTEIYTGTRSIDEIVVLIPARYVRQGDIERIDWRGQTYRSIGLIQIFRRNGRDHHYQVRLERVT